MQNWPLKIAFGISVWLRIYGFIYGSGWKIDSLFEFFNVMYYKSTNPRKQRIVRSRRNFAGEVSNFVQLLSIWRFWLFSDKDLKDCKYLAADYFEIRLSGVSVAGLRIQCRLRLSNAASGKGFQKTKVFTI